MVSSGGGYWFVAGSIALLGAQKATGAQMIFWALYPGSEHFFATFYYHANAGVSKSGWH
jgi:hypothetical protein